jgi:hypothetical protein
MTYCNRRFDCSELQRVLGESLRPVSEAYLHGRLVLRVAEMHVPQLQGLDARTLAHSDATVACDLHSCKCFGTCLS